MTREVDDASSQELMRDESLSIYLLFPFLFKQAYAHFIVHYRSGAYARKSSVRTFFKKKEKNGTSTSM